jgi:hypothetical protein
MKGGDSNSDISSPDSEQGLKPAKAGYATGEETDGVVASNVPWYRTRKCERPALPA